MYCNFYYRYATNSVKCTKINRKEGTRYKLVLNN